MYKIWRLLLQTFLRYDCGHGNRKWAMWPWPRPFRGWFVIRKLGFNTFYPCAKFDDSSLNRSRDIVGA